MYESKISSHNLDPGTGAYIVPSDALVLFVYVLLDSNSFK